MAIQKPSIPKGTRDFSPLETSRRNHIFETIRGVFGLYGFAPIETPAMENLSTLMGKYGEEGDKLLFKVLNSGDFTSGVDFNGPQGLDNPPALAAKICEKGLRYDLTVPFARYVVQHQNEIVFPFKRCQIQPVWRADRPQKGRYREFFQCDADVIGSSSLVCEAELAAMVGEVFHRLGIKVLLKINNRKVLYGIAQTMGCEDKMVEITVAIDKIDKVGMESVCEELAGRGIGQKSIDILKPILELKGGNTEKINKLRTILKNAPTGLQGVDEIESILSYSTALGVKTAMEIDLSLARGLNYYTGAIFEVKALDFQIGSICGGGRYDDLTGIFGMPGMSGVGISFGADRIYDVMTGLGLFNDRDLASTRAMIVNLGGAEERKSLEIMASLRRRGIACEIYPEAAKMKKQMEYANRRGIQKVIIIGSEEMQQGCATVKNMETGEQQKVAFGELTGAI